MKHLIRVLVLFAFAGTASAQIPHIVTSGTRDDFKFKSGNDLLHMCQGDLGEANKLSCIAYIQGVVDLIGVLQVSTNSADGKIVWKYTAVCLPRGVDMGQVRDVVVKYLVENPAERDHSAPALIVPALIAAWGCPAK